MRCFRYKFCGGHADWHIGGGTKFGENVRFVLCSLCLMDFGESAIVKAVSIKDGSPAFPETP